MALSPSKQMLRNTSPSVYFCMKPWYFFLKKPSNYPSADSSLTVYVLVNWGSLAMKRKFQEEILFMEVLLCLFQHGPLKTFTGLRRHRHACSTNSQERATAHASSPPYRMLQSPCLLVNPLISRRRGPQYLHLLCIHALILCKLCSRRHFRILIILYENMWKQQGHYWD